MGTKGIKVDGELLNHLRFADDIVVFAESVLESKRMITVLARENSKDGTVYEYK